MENPAVTLDRLAAEDPDRPLVVVLSRTWTRAEIAGFASRTATRLAALGVGRGDRVAVVRRNAALHLLATAACARLGAVVVPLNFRLPAAEAARVIADAGAAVVIAGPKHADEFDAILPSLPPATWVVDDMDPTTDPVSPTLSEAWRRFSALPAGEHDRPALPPAVVGSDDLFILQYTSGSTGAPKGVTMTYGNVWTSWANVAETLGVCADDVTLTIAPFGHVGGLGTFSLQTMLAGGRVVIQRQFDVGHALELIERERVTTTFGVPTMYDAMARHPDFAGRDLTSLRVAVVGGANASVELLETYARRGVPLCHSWGMTETCGGGTMLLPGEATSHVGSIGRPYPHMEIRLVPPGSDGGTDAASGEMWVRGGNVTRGYWGLDATPALGFARDGWFRTGDLADRDANGYLTLRGRTKDLIISGGENIYPGEVEAQIRTHPDVADVAVIGVPDARWGETPLAFLVMKTGRPRLSLDALRGYLTSRIARFKLPRHVTVVDELPVGPTGKVDRRALAALAAEGHTPGEPWYSA